MAKLFANSGDPDQMLPSAASDLGLHCLSITLLGVSRLQWVNSSLILFLAIWEEAHFTMKKNISKKKIN